MKRKKQPARATVSMSEKAKFPHCDNDVLHSPAECKFCDHYPELQLKRMQDKVNFTGESDKEKTKCPAEEKRDIKTINKWPGNRKFQ